MEQQMESKKHNRAAYETPDIVFTEVNPVWCDTSYEPDKDENETTSISL